MNVSAILARTLSKQDSHSEDADNYNDIVDLRLDVEETIGRDVLECGS